MKKSVNIIYGLILLTGFLLLLSERAGTGVGKRIAYRTFLPFRTCVNNLKELLEAKRENDALSRMVVSLSLRFQELREIQEENNRLRKILGFVQEKKRRIQPVQVVKIVREAGNTIMICKKKPYTIVKEDWPVIGYSGLIGKVRRVLDDYIEVQTLAHVMTGVTVIDSRSRVFGIIKWNGNLIMEGVPLTADVVKGDTLVTSGMGAVYPKGLRVGTVDMVKDEKANYQKVIIVKPVENLEFQEEVFVVVER